MDAVDADPQPQSGFVARLPAEVRQLVYLELWRAYGLRQHVVHHWAGDEADAEPAHFCHWPCTTPFEVRDRTQEDIEALRARRGVALGREMEDAPLGHDLLSPWMNHRMCGRRAEEAYGFEAVQSMMTSASSCWKKGGRRDGETASSRRAPYLPMLLSCKLISAECLASIYEATTFVFTDVITPTLLVGSCDTAIPTKREDPPPNAPPALFAHARSLEVSLGANFSVLLPCTVASDRAPGSGPPHGAYDFHWLKLDRFRSLVRLDVWIAARGLALRYDKDCDFVCANQLDVAALRRMAAALARVVADTVTLSMPLCPGVGPADDEEDGYVEGLVAAAGAPGFRLWKRGTGDRFHPYMHQLRIAALLKKDDKIRTSEAREIRVGYSQITGHCVVPPLAL